MPFAWHGKARRGGAQSRLVSLLGGLYAEVGISRAVLEDGQISAINGAHIAYVEQEGIQKAFDELGSKRWELVAVPSYANKYETAYFKRLK